MVRSIVGGLLVCAAMSACGAKPVAFPRRAAPAGYPAARAEELPGSFPQIARGDIARALEGRRYRVRFGVLPARCWDCPIDAISAAAPERAEGPFEDETRVKAADVTVRLVMPPQRERAEHRLVACVDVAPTLTLAPAPGGPERRVLVLDVQPLDDAPALPLVLDAVTGEPLAHEVETLFDENNTPCDRRKIARTYWDDNLLRWRRTHR
ncbi:MAG: hypothetical protein KIT84_15845 [Labilithrix sp.]|nr:hypothetical protein [Labilithrix sp.]MCW5812500.1 hypothetical protein [Labilithrix sp.]